MSAPLDLQNPPAAGVADSEGAGAPASSIFQRTGIVDGLPFDQYLAGREVSKSGLWTLHTRSPLHAITEREPNEAMRVGTAIHCAVLEPDEFEARFVRGPDDRRGNRWKEAIEEARANGMDCLTAGDYDAAVHIRDTVVLRDPLLRRLTSGGTVREVSAFWTDTETGLRCRARPDAYAPDLKMIVDLKTTKNASAAKWFRRVLDFGYHVQEPHYMDGWRRAGGEADAFVFIVIETDPPYAHQIFELAPPDIREGEAIRREALTKWAECEASGIWPGYPPGVQQLALPKWAFELTDPEDYPDE